MSMESWLERMSGGRRKTVELFNSLGSVTLDRKTVDTEREGDSVLESSIRSSKEDRNKEYTGGSVSYYKVRIGSPMSGSDAYTAECNDIIEALGMNYAEGNAFKAIWRRCAARTLGKKKAGYTDGLYDAEKVAFFASRMIAQERRSDS